MGGPHRAPPQSSLIASSPPIAASGLAMRLR